MYYRVALDTFHFGLATSFEGIDRVLSKIKKYLFFDVVPVKSRNPFYKFSWSFPEFGFNVFFDLKDGCRNCPISIELDGHFFRHDEYSEKFVDFIFSNFGDVLVPQRVDACIDVIYQDCSDFERVDCKFDSPYPTGFPLPHVRDDFKYNVAPFEGHFDIVSDSLRVDLLSCGRGEKKLRVYDKDLDLSRKEHKNYKDVYGLDSVRVFRIEYAIRSDSIKGLFSQYKGISCYSDLVYLILSGMFKRFSFDYVDIDGVFAEDVSFYLKRKASTLDGQITDCLNKMRKYHNLFLDLNEERYKKALNELGEPTLFEKRTYLKNVDFYEVSKSLGVL